MTLTNYLDDLGRVSAGLDEARRKVRELEHERDAAMAAALGAGASIGELATGQRVDASAGGSDPR